MLPFLLFAPSNLRKPDEQSLVLVPQFSVECLERVPKCQMVECLKFGERRQTFAQPVIGDATH